MKICYFLGGIGEPKLDFKVKLLLKNLQKIHESNKQSYDIFINTYSQNFEIDFLNNIDYIDKIYFHRKSPSHLTQLWHSNKNLEKLKNYDYIIFALDDIEIVNFDVKHMIELINDYNLDILSPKINNATHKYMKLSKFNNHISFTNCLEIFNFIATPKGFFKYYEMLDKNHQNIWGVDLFFGYYKIKTGIIWLYESNHLFKGPSKESYYKEMIDYCKKRGFEKNKKECIRVTLEKYYKNIIYETINLNDNGFYWKTSDKDDVYWSNKLNIFKKDITFKNPEEYFKHRKSNNFDLNWSNIKIFKNY
jgi:hypothetical protein